MRTAIAGACAALTLTLTAAAPAAASTISVPPGSDGAGSCSPGSCSTLRAAVAYANANDGTTISLAAGTYSLSQGELQLTANATITGAGASATRIQQTDGVDRVLEIPGTQSGAPTVTLQNLEITGGAETVPLATAAEDLGGGGILDDAAALTLQNVELDHNEVIGATGTANGQAGQDAYGGGIEIPYHPPTGATYKRALTLTNSTIADNTAEGGNGGETMLENFGDDGGFGGGALGGGIFVGQNSSFSATDSTFSANRAVGGAGGADVVTPATTGPANAGDGGTAAGGAINDAYGMFLSGDTLSANSATGGQPGGDIYSAAHVGAGGDAYGGGFGVSGVSGTGLIDIENSTLTGNSAAGGSSPVGTTNAGALGAGSGGALYLISGKTSIESATLDGNRASGGAGSGGGTGGGNVDLNGGVLTPTDTIFAAGGAPTGSENCRVRNTGTVGDGGHNLEDSGPSQCGLSAANGDLIGVGPMLGALAANGGPTETMALAAGSPAIGKGGDCGLSTDQRGQPRPSGGPCDIGAFQREPSDGGTLGGGTPGGGNPGSGGKPSAGRVSIPMQKLIAAADGSVRLTLTCAGAGGCSGTVTLTATQNGSALTARRTRRRPKPKLLVLGSARYSLAAGRRATVTIRLNALGRRLLHAHPRGLPVTVRISTTGSSTMATRTLTIHPPRPSLHHRRHRR